MLDSIHFFLRPWEKRRHRWIFPNSYIYVEIGINALLHMLCLTFWLQGVLNVYPISCLQYVQILLLCVLRRAEYDACSVRKQLRDNKNQAVSPSCSLGTWSKMGQDSQATSDSLTDWSQGNSQLTGHEIRKMGSNSRVRWTHGTSQVPKGMVTWRWQKVRRLGSDKITRKIIGWQQATEMDGSKWATAESSKTFNGRAPLFHHHHHLPTTIPFQKNYLVFHISGL